MKVHIGDYPDRDEKRIIDIQIDPWDSWNADNTIALIALPILKQLQKTKHGAPYTADEDVPEAIRSTSAKPKENEWDTDEFHFDRWEFILSEIIFAFEQICKGDHEAKFFDHSEANYTEDDIMQQIRKIKVDKEGLTLHWTRINNGLRLFSKYYFSLWD